MIYRKIFRNLLILLSVFVTICCTGSGEKDIFGTYRAYFESPGGELAFPLHLLEKDDSLKAYVINGADTTRFTSVNLSGDSVIFSFDYYDSHIRANIHPDGSLSGQWDRRSSGGERKIMPFHAEKGINYRYQSTASATDYFSGNWQIIIKDDDGEAKPAFGIFVTEPDGKIHGTMRTETGDYRFLEGAYSDSSMTLSTFDGAHAYLIKASLQPDESLKGDFWYYNTSHSTWTAQKGESTLRDPMQISAQQAVGKKISFSFPDIQGDTVSAAAEKFRNKPMLVYLFGSWCPNCSDETRMIREIYRDRYENTELQVVGLAYEYTGDFQNDAEMVHRYQQRFNIPWTLLVAGVSDKQQASDTLPFLNDIISFPTSIFVDKYHIIKAIHVGFNGPATGSTYFKEKQSFIKNLDEITQSSETH